jgi:hypothetical protein
MQALMALCPEIAEQVHAGTYNPDLKERNRQRRWGEEAYRAYLPILVAALKDDAPAVNIC